MRIISILTLALGLIGCTAEDRPVATIGTESISVEQLRETVARLSPGLKNKEGGDAARHQYLQSIIDRRLLLAEAIQHGMDTLKAVENKVREKIGRAHV